MQSKILSRRILLIAVFTGLVLSAVIILFFVPKILNSSGTTQIYIDPILPQGSVVASAQQEQPSFGLPVRLKIPGIKVDAAVEYVGLNARGEMDVPEGPANVAWLKLGPHPGDGGSAVIAGHFGRWKNGAGSVFDDLNKLSEGDKLSVEDDKGVTITFVVRESRSYDPNADASAVFSSSDGISHLNLITCEGIWNEASKGYPKRLVIFADKE
jgi:LPXTG-site transpeptidase (sortase) family protein